MADLCGDVEGAIRDMEVSDDKYQEGHGDEITARWRLRRTRALEGEHKGCVSVFGSLKLTWRSFRSLPGKQLELSGRKAGGW
jgi:hypothetical protein